ncbi:unnamed protein product [Ceutorhynchus assimilis]|uniref:Uncharacterized protein n=1 Tax=Ceutorhynchus assimilis TaxID=467358 RepID=A0A9N9MMP5_9CUCU|nr:unnamed protein product [Ceutorhynchus assimilis]
MDEKHQAPESVASVTIKPDYPPSEYCASEPPPAYHRPQSSAVQVAKIIAVTVVVVSFVLGCFILASAYVTATSSCRQLEQDLELLSEVADRFDGPNDAPLQPQALVQDEPKHNKRQSLSEDAPKKNTKDIDDNSVDSSDSSSSDSSASSDSEEDRKVHFKLPLQLDFDDLAGTLIAKNQRSKMNCIVEKKRAEEVVDHQPKTIRLPFGVNLTTDPRYERLSGERMVIICESGNMQSAEPPKPEKPQSDEEDDSDDDNEQETIMIQPVMIPIPHTAFQTHMPQQMQPQEQPRFQIRPVRPMEGMRPPMVPMRPPMENMRPPMEQFRPNMEQFRPNIEQFRPNMEGMRPPMRPIEVRPMMEQPRPPIERIIAIRQNFEPVSQSLDSQQRSEEVEQQRPEMMFVPQQVQIHVEPQQQPQQQQQPDNSPNPIIQHIIQQIITQKIMEAREKNPQPPVFQVPQERAQQMPQVAQRMPPNFPLPEEVLTQLNRLPHNDRVIVAVHEPESSEEDSSDESSDESQEMQQTPAPDNNRQEYVRRLPVNIPVNMMQQQVPEQEETQTAASEEETRPHYVQPRSVSVEEPKSRVARSVNPLLPEKRVKRCACDCAC